VGEERRRIVNKKIMRRYFLALVFLTGMHPVFAQRKWMLHSHNDYEQRTPFHAAFGLGFASIEADVWLVDGHVLVAHDREDLRPERSLDALYLRPLDEAIKAAKGNVYPDGKKLQLMIDIKSAAKPTLDALISEISRYPSLVRNRQVVITISGSRPPVEEYASYPSFIFFDGRPGVTYTKSSLKKVAMISDSYANYVKGGQLDTGKLRPVLEQAHLLKKPFRLWAHPDHPEGWKRMMELGVDVINTDNIEALARFVRDSLSFRLEEKVGRAVLHDSLRLMPYNRIIRSAGTVVRFGSPLLENHALDVVAIPGTRQVAVEDRYGMLVMDLQGRVVDRFTYTDLPAFKSLVSTYSGLKSFRWQNRTWIVWTAASGNQSSLMWAEWADDRLRAIGGMKIDRKAPARNAIPNEVYVDEAEGDLYVVLNGNDELMKIRWQDKKLLWQRPTGGVAPYGVVMANRKLYVSNWAGPVASDSTRERAGVPWGLAYTDPRTGATAMGTVTIMDIETGLVIKELETGLHPNVVKASADGQFVYVANGNSDDVTVINTRSDQVVEQIPVGLYRKEGGKGGSSPVGLSVEGNRLYVSNGMDNAVAVVSLGKSSSLLGKGQTKIEGFIPTEAYPAGSAIVQDTLIVANLESEGANVVNEVKGGRGIHYQLGSVSLIPLPGKEGLQAFTQQVYEQSLKHRIDASLLPSRPGMAPVPVPERIGEPSVFSRVVYIIKENKTYDQVFGDLKGGRGDSSFCVFGERFTPNMHALARTYGWMDNYYASGKSSAEGHQWSNAAIVSDYVEKNVRTWLRSYPHRQTDALVYNKTGYIWNQAMDHGKTVRIFGEACTTVYDEKLKWLDLYRSYQAGQKPNWRNKTTIARIDSIISPLFPDNDNMAFSDQQRADIFMEEWDQLAAAGSLPQLMIVSLPNDHAAGTSPNFPTPDAMVADNDLAVGRIVEHITNSTYFDSTLILITEDDSQGGWDHISAYRTIGMAISAYNRKGVVSTHYNQTSMVRTIEQVLGIPPMNILDATAAPMFDCFVPEKRSVRYTKVPNNIPLDKMNKPLLALRGKEKRLALKSQHELFNEVDGGEDEEMNEVIWYYVKKLRER
jgi:YVTN family beta-propeller protein